jgi:hypothetical protein
MINLASEAGRELPLPPIGFGLIAFGIFAFLLYIVLRFDK